VCGENVPDPPAQEPTDAVVGSTSAGVCGSDLWSHQFMPREDGGRRMGHDVIGP
jgi:threonine dehydrogenase-like Zn-dependent dehydrogenase